MKIIKTLLFASIISLSSLAYAKNEIYCMEGSWQDVPAWQIVTGKNSYTLKGTIPSLDFKKVSTKLTYTPGEKFPLGTFVGTTKSKNKIEIALQIESLNESYPITKNYKGQLKIDGREFELECYSLPK